MFIEEDMPFMLQVEALKFRSVIWVKINIQLLVYSKTSGTIFADQLVKVFMIRWLKS